MRSAAGCARGGQWSRVRTILAPPDAEQPESRSEASLRLEQSMKLQISIDAKTYEVEVEIAEEDYSPQNQDNLPAPAAATIQSTVLRTPPKPGSSLNQDTNEAKLCRSPLAG